MNIAIIPARGGSKRIPRKNIKIFSGKPMISYAINIAVSEQDRNEFTNMLYNALNIDIYANPELTLSNYMNRKKANWLLDNIDEYFY